MTMWLGESRDRLHLEFRLRFLCEPFRPRHMHWIILSVRVEATNYWVSWPSLELGLIRHLKAVYTCNFWCDFWRDFTYKTRLTLPCTNVFFPEASRGFERKLSHIISRHPSFQFLLPWYFVAELRDYKPVRGRPAVAGFVRKIVSKSQEMGLKSRFYAAGSNLRRGEKSYVSAVSRWPTLSH